jgi:hypothetical protein
MKTQSKSTTPKKLTLAAVRMQLADLGLVIAKRDGEYRVNIHSGHEDTAHYTDDLQDALDTGRMIAQRNVGVTTASDDKAPVVIDAPVAFDTIAAEVARAKQCEQAHQIERRNAIARELFASKRNRFVSGCLPDKAATVETWWDRHSQLYITCTTDELCNQIGNSESSGHKDDAAVSHLWALYAFLPAAK